MLVFHRTTQSAAEQILRSGFRDHAARYLTEREWTGVWASDRPLDNSEGASGEIVLHAPCRANDPIGSPPVRYRPMNIIEEF